jgi:hypothetical protein
LHQTLFDGPLVQSDQTLTVLADGRVLIAGGQDQYGYSSNAVTVFDPTTNAFSNLRGMPVKWKDASASLLRDGRVLFTGGLDTTTNQPTDEALLFDPATNTFTITGTAPIPRDFGSQAVLRDGRVLIVGGYLHPLNPDCGSTIPAEVYDPATGWFSLAGGTSPRWDATPVLIPDGRVLLLGGNVLGGNADICSGYLGGVEAFDPESGTVSVLASGVLPNTTVTSAFVLDDGSILLFTYQADDYILTLK